MKVFYWLYKINKRFSFFLSLSLSFSLFLSLSLSISLSLSLSLSLNLCLYVRGKFICSLDDLLSWVLQSAKILLVHLKYKIILVLSHYFFLLNIASLLHFWYKSFYSLPSLLWYCSFSLLKAISITLLLLLPSFKIDNCRCR